MAVAASPAYPSSPLEEKYDKAAGAIQMLPRRAPATTHSLGALAPNGSASASCTSVSALATNPALTTGTTASSSAVPSPAELANSASGGSATGTLEAAAAPAGDAPSPPAPAVANHAASVPTSAARVRRPSHAASTTSLPALAAAGPSSTPQTGIGKMAAAAAAGLKRPGSSTGAAASDENEECTEEHPLSDKCLSARGYHTLHAMQNLFHLPDRWHLLRPLGQGAYGLVISVQDSLSGEPVAVKCITRVFDKPILAKRALREITLLRHFGEHENLTGLIDLDNVWYGYNEIYLYMEPMEADLHQIVRSGQPLSNLHVQFFLYQLLRGMKYIHSANVIHRDLKPGNLLVNSDCELKICDFGLARGFRPVTGETPQGAELRMTEYVATRWYRAPEIMLSNKRYTTSMDVWSIGCILGELLGGKPMFKGKDYVDQLNLILGVLGTPDDSTLESMSSEKSRAYVHSLPRSESVALPSILPDADPMALDLLAKLLMFDPSKRLDVVSALEHPYVGAYHDPEDEPECDVFDKWEEVEKLQTIEELREALTREIHEYRAEVRGMAQAELESGFEEQDYDDVYNDGEDDEVAEPEPMSPTSDKRGRPDATVDTEHVPDSPDERTGSPVDTKLSMAAAAGRSPTLSPRRSRPRLVHSTSSPYTPRTPRTPGGPHAGATDESIGRPPRRASRRSSSHIGLRKSKSFFFGSGMAMSSLAMTSAAALPPQAITTASSSEFTAGSIAEGRRSRAPSGTYGGDLNSLRPLIRQLSTTNLSDLKAVLATDDEPLMTEPPLGTAGSSAGIVMSRRGSRRGSNRVGEMEMEELR